MQSAIDNLAPLPWSAHRRGGPFDLAATGAYGRWRARKLAQGAGGAEPILVADPRRPAAGELGRLREGLARRNFACYRFADPAAIDKESLRAFAAQLGLHRLDANLHADEDAVSAIQVRSGAGAGEFIPYTDQAINWHTDGYYNPPERRIRAFVLHCVRPADRGGESFLLDHELVYLRLRDREPALIGALMRPDAFAIPPLVVDGRELRGWTSGPVFSIDPLTGTLHMRYSARLRNVRWAPAAPVRAAAAALREILDADPAVQRLTLAAGEGLVCNNVLHGRGAFVDRGEGRLLYRARYYDRAAAAADGETAEPCWR